MDSTIKIFFTDFWGNFNLEDNFILDVLKKDFDVVLTPENPDFLFVGTFGGSHLNYDCPKIYFTGENIVPDFNLFDYAIGFDYIDYGDRYFRLPLFCIEPNFGQIILPCAMTSEQALNRKFCSMVVSNVRHSSPMRRLFFKRLSEYKQVDSGGRMWNNIGGPVADKAAFLRGYKFNIAFENSKYDGYTTEKITDAFAADTVPVYWGNRWVTKDFNPESFVTVADESDIDRSIEQIIYLDSHPDEYLKMLKAPKIINPILTEWERRFSHFLRQILSKSPAEARLTSNFGAQKLHRKRVKLLNKLCYDLKGDRIMSLIEKINNKFSKNED